MAFQLRLLHVTCLLMFMVDAKLILEKTGNGNHDDLAARGFSRRVVFKIDPSVGQLSRDIAYRYAYKYAAFKINQDRDRVVIDDHLLGNPSQTKTVEQDEERFNEMKSLLTNKEPRYILYEFRFTTKQGRLIEKLAFILWIPKDVDRFLRLSFPSSSKSVKNAMSGVFVAFEANDLSDLDYTTYMEEITRNI